MNRHGGAGPFEVVQLAFLFIGGVSTLTHLGVPSSISQILPRSILIIWCILLSVGSAVGFIGVIWPGRISTALVIEEVGLIGVVGVALIYIVILITQIGHVQGVTVVTSFVAGLGIQSGWRIVEILHFQRTLLEVSDELPKEKGDQI
jgi:hypothetical protein